MTTLTKHRIDVGSHLPIKQHCYLVSPKVQEAIREEIDKMLGSEIIEPSYSVWSNPIVMVRKPNGKYRFCLDFRKVNSISRKDAYPMPNMGRILDKLRAARYISTNDLSQAYFQIPLEKESCEKTAFSVPGKGLYHFVRMPYGLTGAPTTFQRLLDHLIGPEMAPYVFVYLDDIVIVTPTFEEHIVWLKKVLDKITAAGLTINAEKCEFCKSRVKYLGFVVQHDGLTVDPDKTSPILEYPAPTNLKQLPPTLACPDFEESFVLQTDASSVGLGAVLTQTLEGKERVIAYASRALTDPEKKYSVTEQECLAVVWAVQKFRSYLEGYKFTVITDHSSLRWLHNLKNSTGRLARWALELLEYDYVVEYRKGALHHVPDALSRMFESDQPIAVNALADAASEDEVHDPCRLPDSGGFRPMETGVAARISEECWNEIPVSVPRLNRLAPPVCLMGRRIVEAPWTAIAADIMGPLPRSKGGFQYLLVIQDLFTKWVEYRALRAATGPKIVEALHDLVLSRWGTPAVILTDNGTEFVNRVMRQFAEDNGITHTTVPPYHPQDNPVERVNRVFKTMITAFIDLDHREWDMHLADFRFVYNTAFHTSLGTSPAFLSLGREPKPPNAMRERGRDADPIEPGDPAAWTQRIRDLHAVRVWVEENLDQANQTQAHRYNLRRRPRTYRVGDLVLKRHHALSSAAQNFAAKIAAMSFYERRRLVRRFWARFLLLRDYISENYNSFWAELYELGDELRRLQCVEGTHEVHKVAELGDRTTQTDEVIRGTVDAATQIGADGPVGLRTRGTQTEPGPHVAAPRSFVLVPGI
ncbi:uncharacterized protein LOC113563294 [Ooceraea biroi]|uniref:uncharacterized protein LOC113563294 n=1 Tax=Ooceraea biroi TaxID=2015173 RepID=UPI000F086B60|nr:uncharacterized protein LOC113563294 [Ooceraea biroi]